MPTLNSICKMYVASKAQHSVVMQALANMGYAPRGVYTAVACEVCGTNTEYFNNLKPAAVGALTKVPMSQGSTLHVTPCGAGLILAVDSGFAGGEATLWGRGTLGGCACDKPNTAHWS